jgi:DNA-binding beta-propeller fold protein YncE
MGTRKVVRTIDLTARGFSATAKPHFVAVEPDGAHWYVSLIGENKVVKFDRNDTVVGSYDMETPGMLSIVPGSDLLLASRSMSAVNPPKRVAMIHRDTMTGDEIEVLFPRPHPMAVTANGYAYTGSLGENQIAIVELASERAKVQRIPGPPHAFVQFTIAPNGRHLVAATEVSGRVLVFDLSDPMTPTFAKTIDVGKMAFDPAFTPDGRWLWVPVKSTNDIAVIDTATWTVTKRIASDTFRQPHQVVFSLDGATAFVTNNNKMDHMADPEHAGHDMPGMAAPGGAASLLVIDVASGKILEAIELGRNLTGMGARGSR